MPERSFPFENIVIVARLVASTVHKTLQQHCMYN